MTINEWVELLEVLTDAVDNSHALYMEATGIYNANYRPHRLQALKNEWEQAVKMHARVAVQVEEIRARHFTEPREG